MNMSENAVTGIALFFKHTDAIGVGLSVILLMMSLMTWSLILYKTMFLWQTRQHSKQIATLQLTGQGLSAASLPKNSVFHVYFEHRVLRISQVFDPSISALSLCSSYIQRGQTLLATIASISPYLGLFGTVWGIYHALMSMGGTRMGVEQMIGAVGEALIMTAAGLAVAIPAALAYNLLNRALSEVHSQLHAFASALDETLTRN